MTMSKVRFVLLVTGRRRRQCLDYLNSRVREHGVSISSGCAAWTSWTSGEQKAVTFKRSHLIFPQ
jgi:hypothetical protein